MYFICISHATETLRAMRSQNRGFWICQKHLDQVAGMSISPVSPVYKITSQLLSQSPLESYGKPEQIWQTSFVAEKILPDTLF